MKKSAKILPGTLTLEIWPDNTERFLNICAHHQISLQNLEQFRTQENPKERLHMEISLSDYYRLRPILRKCHAHHRILQKKGPAFLPRKTRKRTRLLLSLLLGCVLLFWLSSRIWSIHLEGNLHNTTPTILEYLKTQNITNGVSKGNIDCGKIAEALRESFPDITWASVRIQGCRLIIKLQENTVSQSPASSKASPQTIRHQNTQPPDAQADGTQVAPAQTPPLPCSLIAEEAGTVIKVITRRGKQMVFPGDQIQKGDLLISGKLELKNDEQQVFQTRLVPADGEIWIERTLSYRETLPFLHTQKEYTAASQTALGFWLGPFYFDTGDLLRFLHPEATDLSRDETIEQKTFLLTENFPLPFVFVKKTVRFWKSHEETYTQKELRTLARQHLLTFEKKLMQKGLQIYKNDVTIDMDETTCKSTGTLTVYQKIGQKQEIQSPEPSPAAFEERNQLDESASH